MISDDRLRAKTASAVEAALDSFEHRAPTPEQIGDYAAEPDNSRPPDFLSNRRGNAYQAIHNALAAELEGPPALAGWRAPQLDVAITLFVNGLYEEAAAQAARSSLPAQEIPIEELRRSMDQSMLEQLRARIHYGH